MGISIPGEPGNQGIIFLLSPTRYKMQYWFDYYMILLPFPLKTTIICCSSLCQCSKAAQKKGYKLFGITWCGSCWGFNVTESQLAKLKKSSGCANATRMTPCRPDDKICTGKQSNSFFYENICKGNITYLFFL